MAEINPSNLIETGSNSIPNGQVAVAMRRSMENKNLLTSKGSLYAGTGQTYSSQDSVGNTYNTAVTDAVEAPTQSGQVLVSNLNSDGPNTGVEWQDAAPNATNATKLTSGTVGSSTTPVYFNNGQPAACGASLAVSITGNAATATSATKATQDENGANIATTYAKQNGTYSGMTVGNATNASQLGGIISNNYFNTDPSKLTPSTASGSGWNIGDSTTILADGVYKIAFNGDDMSTDIVDITIASGSGTACIAGEFNTIFSIMIFSVSAQKMSKISMVTITSGSVTSDYPTISYYFKKIV